MGLLSDESRDVILAHVRAEQDRRFAIAQAFKGILDLCPLSNCSEYVSLLSQISDAQYPAGICGPMTPERVAYEELSDGRARGMHELRRTFATRLRDRGVPLEDVQRLGRWASSKMLLELYSASDGERLRAAANAVGEAMNE